MVKIGRATGKEIKRWRKQKEAAENPQQSMLTVVNDQVVPVAKDPEPTDNPLAKISVKPSRKTICPFCLTVHPAIEYLIQLKKGFSDSKGHCPWCDANMYFETLFRTWTDKDAPPENPAAAYAGWVRSYRGFFKKIDFDDWKRRLFSLGWAGEFWETYKNLKALEGGEETSGSGEPNEGRRSEAEINSLADAYESSFTESG